MEKTVSEAIEFRRSIRKFDARKEIDTEIVKKCLKNGVLAPTSSNLQLWEFYHITNKELLTSISKICFNQPAASTAKEIVITIVRKDLWKLRANQNIDFFNSNKEVLSAKQYDQTKKYYTKAIPLVYKDFYGILSFSKFIFAYLVGIFKVMYRQLRSSDTRIVAHKSAALASQNFMISMSGFGYDTCPMEGFDSLKLKNLLRLNKKSEINMVIGCGIRSKEGVYGKRFRIPFEEVYFRK
ncbi:MAG: nitroreductase family protein [Flavobacteriales bacterium]|nr:MAG: nitroreductase family protein [Flavobacteriales bacterium]CAI8366685.1 MAG: Putative NAD(P)H nitroreductase [Flavobacteriales bacterium]|tara:strand:+ start:1499 stop:2215 length:717 start_codon:yes stop_codon:yes gene_type:complete